MSDVQPINQREISFHQVFAAEAPSNIALIKYMGKSGNEKNWPSNASLSITLPELRTRVEIEKLGDNVQDYWEPLQKNGWIVPELSLKGQMRFLEHWKFLKGKWNVEGSFVIRSANNFPSDCGLASSASSFAALTLAAKEVVEYLLPNELFSRNDWAQLSRLGSGSSCRSFFAPVVYWKEDLLDVWEWPFGPLLHDTVVVESTKKHVSSSEAHKKIESSLLNMGRAERADARLKKLKETFVDRDWPSAFQIIWSEFWDMHALFETSEPSFGYMTAASLEVLRDIHGHWQEFGDGPWVTMDAGANIHLLYREDQKELYSSWKHRWTSLRAESLGRDL